MEPCLKVGCYIIWFPLLYCMLCRSIGVFEQLDGSVIHHLQLGVLVKRTWHHEAAGMPFLRIEQFLVWLLAYVIVWCVHESEGRREEAFVVWSTWYSFITSYMACFVCISWTLVVFWSSIINRLFGLSAHRCVDHSSWRVAMLMTPTRCASIRNVSMFLECL